MKLSSTAILGSVMALLLVETLGRVAVFGPNSLADSDALPFDAPTLTMGPIQITSDYFDASSASTPSQHILTQISSTSISTSRRLKWRRKYANQPEDFELTALWSYGTEAWTRMDSVCAYLFEHYGPRDGLSPDTLFANAAMPHSPRCGGRMKDGRKYRYVFARQTKCHCQALVFALVDDEAWFDFENLTKVELLPDTSCQSQRRTVGYLVASVSVSIAALVGIFGRIIFSRAIDWRSDKGRRVE